MCTSLRRKVILQIIIILYRLAEREQKLQMMRIVGPDQTEMMLQIMMTKGWRQGGGVLMMIKRL